MNDLNRNIHPDFQTIEEIDLLRSKKRNLSNQIPVHLIDGGTQEVVKIEFIFDAGIWYQDAPVIAAMTNSMLNEGTEKLNAGEIAEKFDYYGSYVGFHTSQHTASITLFSLNKYLGETLAVVEDLIKNSIFPEKEFATILNNKRQNFIVEHQKTRVLAKDKLDVIFYGEKHPYANLVTLEDFDRVTPEQIREFHRKHYTPARCSIIAGGKITTEVMQLLEAHFGQTSWPLDENPQEMHYSIKTSAEKKCFIEKPDAVQSAIRIGRPLFNKNHPDYIGMQLLNTVLGGYFGSRLMSNIREDKGYTYGIGSMMIHFPQGGHFLITTEVGTEVCEAALQEIYKEIALLRNELISAEELDLVKNYVTGEILRNLDGPFALADSLKGNLPYDLDNTYYQRYLRETREISAEKLMELANKYLQEEDLFEVVAGKS